MATFDKNAIGVHDMFNRKYDTFPFEGEWYEAFGNPETTGVWIIWGKSTNGKSTFAMKLCKYLCQLGYKVGYNSIEEGACKTMQNTMKLCEMGDVAKRFLLINAEDMAQLSIRLKRPKSPKIVVIDSFQYAEVNGKQFNYTHFKEFKKNHPNKLLIFISQAEGNEPKGKPAISAKYAASLKIYIEGFRAFSQGRFVGPVGYIDIHPERAKKYYSNKNKDNHEENQQQIGDTPTSQGNTCQLPQCG